MGRFVSHSFFDNEPFDIAPVTLDICGFYQRYHPDQASHGWYLPHIAAHGHTCTCEYVFPRSRLVEMERPSPPHHTILWP
jgi:hypothetical protein